MEYYKKMAILLSIMLVLSITVNAGAEHYEFREVA